MNPRWFGVREFADRRIKPLVKGLYRPLVIAAMSHWRTLHTRPVYIGITGSAGKSTTKNLLREVMGAVGPTIANSDSNNQLYSVGRTLLGLYSGVSCVVQELGASKPGGLGPMLRLLRPTVGIVLNIGLDHRTAFRDADAIAQEKSQLIAALPATGLAILNADDVRVSAMASLTRARVLRFGLHEDADVRGEVLTHAWPDHLSLQVTIGSRSVLIDTQLNGSHQATCVLAAVTAAYGLGVPLQEIVKRIAPIQPMRGRMSLLELPGGIAVLRDDWKAPLWSLNASLQVLQAGRAARRIVVLGTLSDYPGSSRGAYRSALRAALDAADLVIAVGARAEGLVRYDSGRSGRVRGFATVKEASAFLAAELQAGDLVLLKGSNHADHLGRVILGLTTEIGCWRQRCDRVVFCEQCGLLRQRVEP